MAHYPQARYRPLHFADSMPARQQSETGIIHTNGGPCDHGSLFDFFNRPGNDIASHYQVGWSIVECYIDPARQAYAAFASNPFGIQIEIQDDGDPAKPMNAFQLAHIVGILKYHHVPARVSPDGPGGGVGWHQQYPDWNRSGHDCPGAVRVAQIQKVIIPALAAPVDTVMLAMPITVYNHVALWRSSWGKRRRWLVDKVPPHDPSIVVLKVPITIYNHLTLWNAAWGKRAEWRVSS